MQNNLGALAVLSLFCMSAAKTDGNFDKLLQHVPGIPGEDYPIFAIAPETSFLCEIQPIEGYYADPEADCQSYHVCSDSGDGIMVKFDFLCPNGTIFNQEEFVCDWWFNVDCSKAEDYYFLNIEVAEKNAERQRQRDNERNTGVRDDRQRTELTADEINELRNGGGLQEKTRTSSNNTFKRPIQPTSATTLTPKRIFSNHFGFSGQAITPFPKHIIGRPKPQSSAVLLRGEKGKKKSRLRKLKNNQPKINQFQPDPFSNFGNGKSRFGNF